MVVAARQFVRSRLEAWEVTDHVEAAVLIASELVTNAVLHARTSISLKLLYEGGKLRIEVYDENTRVPVQSACPPDATSGRGLALVSALAGAWGIDHSGDGKTVWAELGDVDTDAPEDCVDLSGVDTVEEAFDRIDNSDPDTATH